MKIIASSRERDGAIENRHSYFESSYLNSTQLIDGQFNIVSMYQYILADTWQMGSFPLETD